MDDFAHITKCIELTEDDIRVAIESREGTRALLQRLSRVSSPGTGIAKMLLLLARMATTACDWLDGDLRIEIVGDKDVCAVELLVELGLGMRERVFPPFPFNAPLDEMARAIERVPHMIAPLATLAKTERRIVLAASADTRRSSLPPAIKIDETSFYVPKAPPAPKGATPAAESPSPGPVLPVVTPTLPTAGAPRRKSSKPPPAPRVQVTGKRITIVKEAPPPELPVVTPVGKAKAASPPPPPPPRKPTKRPPPATAKDPTDDEDDVDSGWED